MEFDAHAGGGLNRHHDIDYSENEAEQNGCRHGLVWHLSCHRRFCQHPLVLPCGLPPASYVAPLRSLAVA